MSAQYPELSELKVGMRVFVVRSDYTNRDRYQTVTVTRVLRRYFETSDGGLWRDGGRERGGTGYHQPRVVLQTPETIATAREANAAVRHRHNAEELHHADWASMPREVVSEAYQVLKEHLEKVAAK